MRNPIAITILLSALLGMVNLAQARVKVNVGYSNYGHHSSGYGFSYVTKKVFVGYDRYRRAVYRTVKVPVKRGGYYSSAHSNLRQYKSRGGAQAYYKNSRYGSGNYRR